MIKKTIKTLKIYILSKFVSKVSRRVKNRKLTYLTYEKILNIENCIKDIATKNISGSFVEAGIALGGSAIIIADLMPPNRTFHGYDVFEMIPPPSEKDDKSSKARYDVIKSGQSKGIDGDPYYGYMESLYENVIKNFEIFDLQVDNKRIYLHKGLFENTMNFNQNVALAHIDCDWYEPVNFVLNKVYPVLSNGGYIIVDDYYDYGGCKKSVDEFLQEQNDMHIVKSGSNVVLIRK